MGRKKLIRCQQIQKHPLLVQSGHHFYTQSKAQRREHFFHNTNPIVLELACGRAEYSVTLAKLFPHKNFIGVDIKGERMWTGIQQVQQQGLSNVGCLRTIIQNIDRFFAPNEVDEIRIIHPDPRSKVGDEKRRLTHPRFLKMYQHILKPNGLLMLKTDDGNFFDYSLKSLQQHKRTLIDHTNDLHQSPLLTEHHDIITKYEQKALQRGERIKYAKWGCIQS